MRKNLRGASSADDDEERYLDEEEQEEEPAPKSRKRKKKGELRSSIPDDAPPPALSPGDQMMTMWKNTELLNGPVPRAGGIALRSAPAYVCAPLWLARLIYTTPACSHPPPDGGGIIECAFYTIALYALLARLVQ
jgi:hypothetical protein